MKDITLTGTSGLTHRVQTSSDLREWTDLESPINCTGSEIIHDSLLAMASAEFYRLVCHNGDGS